MYVVGIWKDAQQELYLITMGRKKLTMFCSRIYQDAWPLLHRISLNPQHLVYLRCNSSAYYCVLSLILSRPHNMDQFGMGAERGLLSGCTFCIRSQSGSFLERYMARAAAIQLQDSQQLLWSTGIKLLLSRGTSFCWLYLAGGYQLGERITSGPMFDVLPKTYVCVHLYIGMEALASTTIQSSVPGGTGTVNKTWRYFNLQSRYVITFRK